MSNLGPILGFDDDEPVMVSVGPWSETRAMMTSDGNCKFKQVKFGKTWALYDLIEPPLGDWYKVEATAAVLGLSIVGSAWTGPLSRLPQNLLLSEETIMIRSKRLAGWVNLKSEVAAACEGSA